MRIFNDFLDLIFPRLCLACNQSLIQAEAHICTHCRMVIPKTRIHEYDGDQIIKRFYGRIQLKYALGYLKFSKKDRVQRLIHQLKYKNKPEVGHVLGNWYGIDLSEAGYRGKFDLVLPVPLHPKKLKKRGYNQAECFASALADQLQAECRSDLLQRTQYTETQTKKGKYERWKNVEGLFEVVRSDEIKGKHVLLADDVVTTGATLEACAEVLLKAGCQAVSVVTMAVAQ